MSFDIAHLLDQWDYQPGQVVVRKFIGQDGLEKLQLRVDLGILQMNTHGRPDGKRPSGHESLFEHFRAQLEKYRQTHEESDDGFTLQAEDCGRLQQEAIQYHHRYICFFQLEDFAGVIRDCQRNLAVFDFVKRYSPAEEYSWAMQQFRPQLLMMKTRAQGAIGLRAEKFEEAIRIIEAGLQEIRSFYHEYSRQDLLENSGEIQSLEAWLSEIQSKRPLTERERLQNDLEEAVRREDYERAARVRDALRNLKTSA